MNLRQLEIFCAVMRCRTTIAAAYELGLSQPAVSNAIKHFEGTLGFSLFERVGNRLVPTAEGISVYRDAQPLEMMASALNQRVKDLKDTKRGHLRILSTRPLGDTMVPEAIQLFLQGRDNVHVYFDVQNLDSVVEGVESGYADIGIALEPAPRPGLKVDQLISGAMVCILPKDHPLAKAPTLSPRDFENVPLIGLDPSSRLGSSVGAAFHNAGVAMMPNIDVLQGAAACSLVLRGLGLAIVDQFSASNYSAQGLVSRPFEPHIRVAVSIISLADRPLTRLAKRFVHHLESTCQARTASTNG